MLSVMFPNPADTGATGGTNWPDYAVSLFTGRDGFDPVEFNTTPPFGPNLVTNTEFSNGGIRMVGGTNPLNSPFGIGYLMWQGAIRVGELGARNNEQLADHVNDWVLDAVGAIQNFAMDKKMLNVRFDPPIRMKRGRPLCVQLQGADLTFQYNPNPRLVVSAIVNELPNPIGLFQT